MKLWFQHLAILAAIALVVGAVVVLSGIVPIKASSGHWAVTRWLLSFSMSRSVATHSLSVGQPPEANRRELLQGAGHYQTGCVQCHGSPERGPNPIAKALTPTPPRLQQAAAEWDAKELFYIVMHGVKLTGMPAWPELKRSDEVWAMVGFLEQLPELDKEQYRELVYGTVSDDQKEFNFETKTPELKYLVRVTCGRCHGVDGYGREGAFPQLAGQNASYLAASLRAYASAERHSGIMQAVAVPLQDEYIDQLAEYYAARPLIAVDQDADDADTNENAADDQAESPSEGFQISHQGVPERRIPACIDCHNQQTSNEYPVLAAQEEYYLQQQLKLFRDRIRGGTSYADLMHPVTDQMTDADIQAVAEYYSALDSQPVPQQ